MINIKKTDHTKYWWRCRGTETLIQHFGRVFQICKKLNICLLYDPAILFVDFYSREKVAYVHIDMYKNSSSIYSSQQMELIHIAFNWWMSK